jgi:hypothetical protein
LQALFDTRAGGYTYIGRIVAKALVRRFDLKLIPLLKAVPVRGYNGMLGAPATHYILVNLSVEGRTYRDCPLVILDSLSQDIIVGRNLMRY